MSASRSGMSYLPGQQAALGGSVFNPGGIYDQFLQGKPNAGFERAQTSALQQLQAQQAQSGSLNTPLGTRQTSDFLQKSTQASGDKFYEQLATFMQPAGSKNKGATGLFGGK